jgi:hypothetical protein
MNALLVITPAVFAMNRLKHNSHVPSKRTRLQVLALFVGVALCGPYAFEEVKLNAGRPRSAAATIKTDLANCQTLSLLGGRY